MIGKQQTYYVEENEKFLNLLISNCEPILSEIVSKFESFNKLNHIETAFEQQQGANQGLYGEDEMDINDILDPIIDEFSIKEDCQIKKAKPAKVQQRKVGGQTMSQQQFPTNNNMPSFSYKNLKNNYLGRISSPTERANDAEAERRTAIRDELTPEQMFE